MTSTLTDPLLTKDDWKSRIASSSGIYHRVLNRDGVDKSAEIAIQLVYADDHDVAKNLMNDLCLTLAKDRRHLYALKTAGTQKMALTDTRARLRAKLNARK
jgi:hypothetical protein